MANYSVPSIYIPGFEVIIKLDAIQIDSLSHIISDIKVGERFDSLIERIKVRLESLSEIDASNIIRSLVSLVEIFDSTNRDIPKFTKDFSEAYLQSNPSASLNDKEKLEINLSKLLTKYDSIRITSKAIDIIQENQVNFRKARVISDIRLVFDDDLDGVRKYAVVVHNLKLECYNSNREIDFFAAMDLSDLKSIRDVIDRAIEKDRIIRQAKHELDIIDIK